MRDEHLHRQPRDEGMLAPQISIADVVSDANSEARAEANEWFSRSQGEQTLEQQRAVNVHRKKG